MTDTNIIDTASINALLRKSVPATLKALELAIQDGMREPVQDLSVRTYLIRQANTLDTVARILFAQCLANPGKVSPHLVRVALDAMTGSTNALKLLDQLFYQEQVGCIR